MWGSDCSNWTSLYCMWISFGHFLNNLLSLACVTAAAGTSFSSVGVRSLFHTFV